MKKTSDPVTSSAKALKNSQVSASGRKPARGKSHSPPLTKIQSSPNVKSTKIEQCLVLLNKPGGATLDELQEATGWLAHSVRGFLAGTVKKKLGLILESKKAGDGTRRYRIVKDAV